MNRPRWARPTLGPDGWRIKARASGTRRVRPALRLERRPLRLLERMQVRFELVYHRWLAWRARRRVSLISRQHQRALEDAMARSRRLDRDET